jgi:hypothetical protein
MAVVFVAGTAIARPLNFSGTLTTIIDTLPNLSATGGGVATVNGSSGAIPAHLQALRLAGSRGVVTGTDDVILTDPDTAGNAIARIIIQFQARTGTLNGISGAIASTGSMSHRVFPIGGVAKICLLSTVCTDFLPLILTEGGGTKGVGVGGLITVGGESPIRISVEAAPWTVKTATAVDQTDDNTGAAAFHNVTAQGFAHGPLSNTTSTAAPSGVLQIVTPAQVRTNLPLGTSIKVSTLTTLLIHFIPEPGLLLLIGSGVVGLVVLGRSRMRH